MGNGMNKILPGLFLGNFKDARDADQLKKKNITDILSIHDSARSMLDDLKYLCIPASDSPTQNLSTKFIHECRLRGVGCLVHCLAGVSRSDIGGSLSHDCHRSALGGCSHSRESSKIMCQHRLSKQRQDFEKDGLNQFHLWLQETYGKSPFNDSEEAKNLLLKYKEQQAELQGAARPWSSNFTS